MGAHKDYRVGSLARFGERDVLSKDELYDHFWANRSLDRLEVIGLFDLIEEAYEIAAGILRPDDSIEILTNRVPEKHWWRGPIHDVIAGDRQFWLEQELVNKLNHYGTYDHVHRVNTIDELVLAWCGCWPTTAAEQIGAERRVSHQTWSCEG
jgi:hypothetical protein